MTHLWLYQTYFHLAIHSQHNYKPLILSSLDSNRTVIFAATKFTKNSRICLPIASEFLTNLSMIRHCFRYLGTCALAAAFLVFQQNSEAVLIASQGFEAEPTPSTSDSEFLDTDITSHALADQALENVVSAGIGGELGFSAFHTSTASNGHNDGDNVGVHSVAQINLSGGTWSGSMADGSSNAYLLDDPDGITTITFDAVDLSSATNVVVSLDFQAKDTGWEASDRMHVRITTNLGSNFLLNLSDDPPSEGTWQNLSFNIPDAATTATLDVELESNFNAEGIIFRQHPVQWRRCS